MTEKASNLALGLACVLLCGSAAWAVSQFGWDPTHKMLLPFAFLALVLLLGLHYGRAVGMLGSIASALIFAHALYQPVGSFFVSDQTARSVLAWTVLIGVSTSFLFLPTQDEVHHHRKK